MYVSLNHNGIIAMNRLAFEKLGSPEAVTLHFDIDNLSIGLKPCPLTAWNAFPISQRGTGTRIIWAKAFMKANQLFMSRTYRFLTPVIEDGYLVLDFNHIAITTQSPRTGWRKSK
jgi:hypothetical protein